MQKAEIRKLILEKRACLDKYQKHELDLQINQFLQNFLIENFKMDNELKIFAYFPAESKNEIDTIPFLNFCIKNNVKIFLPRVVGDFLEIVETNDLGNLEFNHLGIGEPTNLLKNSGEKKFDLIIVPGIAFDYQLNRIGYGKGYYDKILKIITGLKLAVAYEFQILEKIPSENFDVKMDLLITEKSFLK